jgi:4-hydroxy-tetrahydrodipicolinate reductase
MIEMAVNGAAGRMGQALVRIIAEDPATALVGALEVAGHEALGEDAGRVAGIGPLDVCIAEKLTKQPEVLVDFSTPLSALERLEFCAWAHVNMVIGTTGFTAEQREQIEAGAHQTAILMAPNMSIGVNLLYEVAALVAQKLTADFDVEIVETHHRFKADAPSGTAVALARSICEATGRDFDEAVIYGREGRTGERPRGQIGIHAVRAGDIVGEHRIVFGGPGERVELVHAAHTRNAFARGAVRAAKFLARCRPGMYDMRDVLDADVPED